MSDTAADDAVEDANRSASLRILGTGHVHRCDGEQFLPGDCHVAILQSTYLAIFEHLKSDTSREQGGLLLGYELRSTDGPDVVVVTGALKAKHSTGTPLRLEMPAETWQAFDEATEQLRGLGFAVKRVGWYHSHPSLGIFLSKWDIDVCSNFPKATHIALVIDPVGNKGGFFVHGTGQYRPHDPHGCFEIHDVKKEPVINWSNATTAPAWGSQGVDESRLPVVDGRTPVPAPRPAATEQPSSTAVQRPSGDVTPGGQAPSPVSRPIAPAPPLPLSSAPPTSDQAGDAKAGHVPKDVKSGLLDRRINSEAVRRNRRVLLAVAAAIFLIGLGGGLRSVQRRSARVDEELRKQREALTRHEQLIAEIKSAIQTLNAGPRGRAPEQFRLQSETLAKHDRLIAEIQSAIKTLNGKVAAALKAKPPVESADKKEQSPH